VFKILQLVDGSWVTPITLSGQYTSEDAAKQGVKEFFESLQDTIEQFTEGKDDHTIVAKSFRNIYTFMIVEIKSELTYVLFKIDNHDHPFTNDNTKITDLCQDPIVWMDKP
jgi:DNA-directed RNA polymerase subunit L